MSETADNSEAERLEAAASFTRADRACTFGPSFFLSHLGRFLRDHWPDPEEHLPMVEERRDAASELDPAQ
jgi:hypothetical protein